MTRLSGIALAAALTAAAYCAEPTGTIYKIETVAGSSSNGDGGPALAAQIGNMQGMAVDRAGNIYVSDTDQSRVRKISASGTISTIAGTGIAGFTGDGGPASAAQLNLPYGLAADQAGNLYIADLGNDRVRRIGTDGVITTVAGTGGQGSAGDGGAAVSAQLLTPRNVAVDAAGNLYISEFDGHRVRKVTADGKISIVAGTGVAGFGGDGGLAINAQMGFPAGLALGSSGNLYIADTQNQAIRKVTPNGLISTVAGGPKSPVLVTPVGVTIDGVGNVYIADSGGVHCLTPAGRWIDFTIDFTGMGTPRDLAIDLGGNLNIADGMHVRRTPANPNNANPNVQTVAGDGYLHAIGDGGPARGANLLRPESVALDSAGNLYIADAGTQRVRRVLASGTIQTFAGTGIGGYDKDGVQAAAAELHVPTGLALDAYGNVFIADSFNHRLREVGLDGRIVTFAGIASAQGTGGAGAEGLPPSQTQLNGPQGVCVSRSGTIFIVDTANSRVLSAVPGAMVETAAGNGAPGSAGDGGAARFAQLNQPAACAADSFGNLFIADTSSNRIARVTSNGLIATVAGTGAAGAGGDEGPATAALLNAPRGVAVDDNGDLYIADTGNNLIRLVTPDGTIHTIGGQGAAGFAGDDGLATGALLSAPGGLLLDGSGDLYFADTNNNRVRRLVPQAAAVQQPATTPNPPPVPVPVPVPPAPVVPPAFTIVNAASLSQGAVAPGEVISVKAVALGTQTTSAAADVRFDGSAATLISAQPGQINAQVPYTVSGQSTTRVEIFYQGVSLGSTVLTVVAAAPGLFAAIPNQDGTLNSQANPAAQGTIVTFYATGEGLTDGASPYPHPRFPVTLTVAGVNAEILFAGGTPGLIGILQVNARIPGAPSGQADVQLTVGPATSPPVSMWIQ